MQPAFRREHLRGYVTVMRQEIEAHGTERLEAFLEDYPVATNGE